MMVPFYFCHKLLRGKLTGGLQELTVAVTHKNRYSTQQSVLLQTKATEVIFHPRVVVSVA